MVSVLSYNDIGGGSKCERFLVQDNFVLGAVHCNGRKISVILGAHKIRKMENSQQVIPVLKSFPHNDNSKVNDIRLLKLQNKAQLNWAVKTITLLQSQDWLRPGQVCSVAGYGKQASGKKANTLQEMDLEVQNEQKCKDLFKNYNSIQLCVRNPNNKKATTSGDSRGRLVCNNMAQGIVSFGKRNGKPPHIFTRISSFLPWIKSTIVQAAGTRLRCPQD
ncbi:mast cell protease 8-like [Equus przewalskii]|uniref:Mast cell protease 8-like n=1 Tax=Equus przewalskii TaxID=9798 RepID=A0ABM2EC15_EQUPR|nr:granzyme-like protein 2 [Equus caballus]